jgi:hypothetical protein
VIEFYPRPVRVPDKRLEPETKHNPGWAFAPEAPLVARDQVVGRCCKARQQGPCSLMRSIARRPAHCGGKRALMLTRPGATFELARQVRIGAASLGEVFAFCSGLYFRGKIAYAHHLPSHLKALRGCNHYAQPWIGRCRNIDRHMRAFRICENSR